MRWFELVRLSNSIGQKPQRLFNPKSNLHSWNIDEKIYNTQICFGNKIQIFFVFIELNQNERIAPHHHQEGISQSEMGLRHHRWKRCGTHIQVKEIQSNSVITNSTGPSIFVRYNRDIVINVKLYVVKSPIGTKNILKFCSLLPWICYNRDLYNRVRLYLGKQSYSYEI